MLLVQGPPIAQPLVVFVERVGAPVVGIAEVLQTIPLTVTVAPPSEDIVPPPVAVVAVILVTGVVVVTVGVVLPTQMIPFQVQLGSRFVVTVARARGMALLL